jgi:type II secretory pathway pseudopilin PulG
MRENWKLKIEDRKFTKGISLIEILIVVSIFAVVGVLVAQSVLYSVRSSRKSESLSHVRNNLDYAISIMERQLRNAESITTCSGASVSKLDFYDSLGNATYFQCTGGYIASGSATIRLTSDEVELTSCSFTCNPGSADEPDSIFIKLTGKDATAQGVESAEFTAETQVLLRNY